MRLLIMSCSATKRDDAGELEALQRYDGPMWRTLRARLDELPAAVRAFDEGVGELEILVLSARFGFINARSPIADYDQAMTPARAAELRDQVRRPIGQGFTVRRKVEQARDVLVACGRLYSSVVREAAPTIPGRCYVHGDGIGHHRAHLSAWMRGHFQENAQ